MNPKFSFKKIFWSFSQAYVVQYVFPPSESRSYNVAVAPRPILDILDSSSPLIEVPPMCFSIDHQESHETNPSFSTQQQSQ